MYLKAGNCVVLHADSLPLKSEGKLSWLRVFGQEQGAEALSLFYLSCEPGTSPNLDLGASESVLYLLEGQSTVIISGRSFDVTAGCGIHVRKGEDCHFVTGEREMATWLAVVCPQRAEIDFSDSARGTFDGAYPERIVDGARSEQHSTADRYYKLLVGPKAGSESITQFIGSIPRSKAPEHFHLYEEVICILSGHGRMWAGDQSVEVRPGSMIFLPRKQRHSLECLDEDGMKLVGMFYPAGSPAINYEI